MNTEVGPEVEAGAGLSSSSVLGSVVDGATASTVSQAHDNPLRLHWTERASCRGHSDLFFAYGGSFDQAAAIRLCRSCPVRPECLAHVMATESSYDRFGVVAGLTPAERHRWDRRR